MKKNFLAVLLLCLLAVLAVSCGEPTPPEECKHKNLTETKYQPSCSLEGYIQHVCLDCGHTYQSDFVEPAGHKLTTVITPPTCSVEGYTTYICDVCDYTYDTGFIAPTGHTLTSKITPQTCTEEGYTTYTCACGYSYRTALIIPNGHNLTAAVTAPTCTEEGYTTYTCPCGYSYRTALVAPTGHNLSKSVVEPTCLNMGYDLYACSACDYSYQAAFVPTKHTLQETTVTPTCATEGYTLFACKDCDYSYKGNYVAPKGHEFSTKTIAPTFSTSGYTIFTCKCGFSYIGDYVWYSNVFSGVSGNQDKNCAFGVDLSYHNKTVDFEALAADGVDFVILRAGYDGHVDTKFEEYYAAARKAGLDIGAYIYTYATNADDLVTYTSTLLRALEGKTFEYPIYLDMEDAAQKNLPTETLMEMCYAYCDLLVQKRYYPGVYSYLNFIQTKLNTEQLAAYFDVWIAHYPLNMTVLGKDYYVNDYSMWQYTENGSVDGVTGKVDLNICYKDYPTIIKDNGYNGYTK